MFSRRSTGWYLLVGTLGVLAAGIVVVVTRGVDRVGALEVGEKAPHAPAQRAAQVEVPPVQVIVTKLIPQAGRYVYRYTVVNGSAFPITNVLVGEDYELGTHEITYPPMGWEGDSIPPTSFKAPPGWRFKSVTVEEDSVGFVAWDILRHGEEILGGASLSGFEVTLDNVDNAYENGHWTVYLNSTEEASYTGWLQPSGVTAVPVSSVMGKSDLKLGPNPAEGRVGIQFAVPVAGVTSVDVFDAQGRLVKRVLKKQLAAGDASASWDGRDEAGKPVAAGVYFVRVKTPRTVRFGRVTWLH